MIPALQSDVVRPGDAAPVVWTAAAANGSAAARALDMWARARGIRLTRPARDSTVGITVDLHVGEEVEADLARARDALATIDIDGAEHALAEAGALLREHPELPQAAWLRAEVERAWATRWVRGVPQDLERARSASARAAALDGGRLAGLGEETGPPPQRADVTITLQGGGRGAPLRLYVDGVETRPPRTRSGDVHTRLAPGEHQVILMDGEIVRWADWVGTAAGSHVVIPLYSAPPCSDGDLGFAHATPRRVEAEGVRCPVWVAAIPTTEGVRVATCLGAACSALVEVRGDAAPRSSPSDARGRRDRVRAWPAWATWTIVGAAAVTATGLTLYAAGVFDGPSHETRFENGGLKTTGFAF